MMPRPVDVEAAAVAYLAAALTGVTVGTERPVATDWQPLLAPLVRVQVVGGGPARSLVLDDSILSVEAWAADSVTCADLASQLCGLLDDWSGVHAGALIYRAESSRPRSVPDPVTQTPRYLFTVQVSARRTT